MRHARNRSSGFAVLFALSVAACNESPTSPSRLPIPTLSTPTSAIALVDGIRACTFGAGYWKTHPHAWPRRFDPNAIFFASGKSWMEVLKTPPRGNAYYILAHQFIAAGLNLEQLDSNLRPDEIGSPWAISGSGYFTEGEHSNLIRTELIDLATLFENFNEGQRGVPPCR